MHKILSPALVLLRFIYLYPLTVIFFLLGVTTVSIYYTLKLPTNTDLIDLLPESHPSVKEMNKLKNTLGAEIPLEIIISGSSSSSVIAFTSTLADSATQLYSTTINEPTFSQVVFERNIYNADKNMLYLATEKELDQIITQLETGINTIKQRSNPFFIDIEENIPQTDSVIRSEISPFTQEYLNKSQYTSNEDTTLLLMTLYPRGSKSHQAFIDEMFNDITSLLARLIDSEPHYKDIQFYLGGGLRWHYQTIRSINNDTKNGFFSGLSAMVFVVLLYFFSKKYLSSRNEKNHFLWKHIIHAPIILLIIFFPIITGLSGIFALTYFIYGSLNIMTSMLFAILFGLSIDYAIHFYASYIESRSIDNRPYHALLKTYIRTGESILLSGITTAGALYVLFITDFKGISQFGIIAGTGIIFTLLSTFITMPALLVLFDRYNLLLLGLKTKNNIQTFWKTPFPFTGMILCVSFIGLVLLFFSFQKLSFEYDLSNLGLKFKEQETYKMIKTKIVKSTLPNPAYILVSSDEDALEIIDTLYQRKKQSSKEDNMIQHIEAFQLRMPKDKQQQQAKLSKIKKINSLAHNQWLVDVDIEQINLLKELSAITEIPNQNSLPSYFTNPYSDKAGNLGSFIAIYPNKNKSINNVINGFKFKSQLSDIQTQSGKTYHAVNTSIILWDIFILLHQESPWFIGLTFILMFIFLFYSFRNFLWTFITMVPLVSGLFILFGIMIIFQIKFNLYNTIILPAILGIGADGGVHIVKSYLSKGRLSILNLLSSTGQHLTIGALTTLIGFLGLVLSSHPGLQSMGTLAMIGILSTLISTLIILPAIIQFIENYNLIDIPYRMNNRINIRQKLLHKAHIGKISTSSKKKEKIEQGL